MFQMRHLEESHLKRMNALLLIQKGCKMLVKRHAYLKTLRNISKIQGAFKTYK